MNKNKKIKAVHARQIVDCKCRPCVETDVITEDGVIGTGSAPTGSSVGMYESFVLRDLDPSDYHGMSVHKAVRNVNEIIAPALRGMDVMDQRAIDNRMIELDGTPLKEKLGGNAIYSVSVAVLRAMAASLRKPVYACISEGKIDTVPVPSFNVINGGRYGHLTQAFNEFIIVPYAAETIDQAVEMGIAVFQELHGVLTDYLGYPPITAPSYGYQAPSEDPEICLSLIERAIRNCHYEGQVTFAIDGAASEMYDKKTWTYQLKGRSVSSEEMIDYINELTKRFPFLFLEDMLDENDWDGWQRLHKQVFRSNIIGDDFIVTNRSRLEKAYRSNALDGFILKPNQVGTITEAMDTYEYATDHDLLAITSGRSGGVIGDIVMDLAVGLQIGFIKNGAPRSGERIDKLNFLLKAADQNAPCGLADIRPLLKY